MTANDRPASGKAGFRGLKVVAKTVESSLITSIYLEAEDGSVLPSFRPGQFLVFKFPAENDKGYVLRNYSLSGAPDDQMRYRISVKREPAAGPDLPVGFGSNHLHDQVEIGDVLSVEGPRGEFVLDEQSDRPVVLLSGGVGLTPMVSMLHALAQRSERRALFVHACENGDVHALRREVDAVIGQRAGLAAHYRYRMPLDADRSAGHFHGEGVITREVLQELLCLDDYEFYLCGPPGFMQAVYQTLRGLGVAKDRIAYEFFGPATVLDTEVKPIVAAAPVAAPAEAGEAITVEFRKSGITVAWDDATGSILDLAENAGLTPDFSCRAGICGTCVARSLSGEVSYFEDPLDEMGEGEVLLCCSRPKTALVLDL
ncbi:2Fe-2S iron-sulfur cluster-binding protein [Xinfangfangia sp. CPCC 101601]|uniref:2Fe-2S iron-sulfur cluster-binding protein n=1 Tax=Pseudogemmobacter lacusdianii TaxID=3069608 RepID=A0ABU0VW88_9RHOB|nr:2Fe-2S iron-sulfur cluster-binding protein [Xinfangfangia sp. CPCC 101601]MDQ2066021.1 2Fe-2S iron-sulfur cluster-binding protein [Xinfangfangia sp. CPCC 101601]